MAEQQSTITWTAGNGSAVTVEALGYGEYRVTLAGRALGTGCLNTAMQVIPDAAYRAGIRGMLMVRPAVGVSAERIAALVALDATMTARLDAARAEEREMARLEAAVTETRGRIVRDGYGDTDARRAAEQDAVEALAAYRATHPALWTRVQAQRAAARTAHQAEVRQGLVARGED
jgi:hypothetical protein